MGCRKAVSDSSSRLIAASISRFHRVAADLLRNVCRIVPSSSQTSQNGPIVCWQTYISVFNHGRGIEFPPPLALVGGVALTMIGYPVLRRLGKIFAEPLTEFAAQQTVFARGRDRASHYLRHAPRFSRRQRIASSAILFASSTISQSPLG